MSDVVAQIIKLQPKKGDVLIISGANMHELEQLAVGLRQAFSGEQKLDVPVLFLPQSMDVKIQRIDYLLDWLGEEKERLENRG